MKSAQTHQLVLVHGWASHPQVFRGLARALEKRFRLQVLALPGYGDTPACNPYTLERLVETLAAAAPKSCSVLGWSLGAQVALAWARGAPQQVSRLALIGATPCFTQGKDWPHAVSAQTLRQFTSQIKRDCPSVLRRFVALQSLGDAHAVRVAHKLRTVLFTNPSPTQAVLEAGLKILRTTDLRDALPSIQQPTLVIHGEHDAVTPLAAGQALAAALPKARFELLKGAGHAPFISDNDAVATLLTAFLDEPVTV